MKTEVAQGHFGLFVRNWCHDSAGVMDKHQPAKPPGAQGEHSDAPCWSKGLKDYLRTCNIINVMVLDWFSPPDWTHPALGSICAASCSHSSWNSALQLGPCEAAHPFLNLWPSKLIWGQPPSLFTGAAPCPQRWHPRKSKTWYNFTMAKVDICIRKVFLTHFLFHWQDKNWKNTVLSQKLPRFDFHPPGEERLGEKKSEAICLLLQEMLKIRTPSTWGKQRNGKQTLNHAGLVIIPPRLHLRTRWSCTWKKKQPT